MTSETADILVVGAGHAGVQMALTMVKTGDTRSILIVGAEPHLPYERPPLTKRLLYRAADPEPALLRSPDYWSRSPVRLMLGERVVTVDARAKTVTTSAGTSISYGTLVWAAGGTATLPRFPGHGLSGVHSIRGHDDLVALRRRLPQASHITVVGAGFIGLETASALRVLGIAVTVIEAAARPLNRVTSPIVSDYFSDLHRAHDVDLRLGTGVAEFLGADGVLTAVRLDDGTVVRTDAVIVGVGMTPVVAPVIEAGAKGDDGGLDVDERCRTSLTDVYAIGDCARQVSPWSSGVGARRVESVHNAGQQAAAVVGSLRGEAVSRSAPPRFWSEQHGQELKTVGLWDPADETVLRGRPASGSFSVVYLRAGRMVALDAVNRPRDYARAQSLIASGWNPDDLDAFADSTVDLPRL
ncbi:NAD(P)/FAD-dependent oxidoreductase [Streptomyces mirabilis]|uniref:NAD(P)/FAD-dependent oxidoreductase n=1 Tax=Streptomyces mirabilis TaxID=68239 RepID=UPI0036B7119A